MTHNCYILFALNCNCSQLNLCWQTIQKNPVHSTHKLSAYVKKSRAVLIYAEPDQSWFAFLTFLFFIHHLQKEEDFEWRNLQPSTDHEWSQKFVFAVFHRLTYSITWFWFHHFWRQVRTSQDDSYSHILVLSVRYHSVEHIEHYSWPHIRTPWLLSTSECLKKWLSFLRSSACSSNNTVVNLHQQRIQRLHFRSCVNSSVSRSALNRQRIQRSFSDLPAVMLLCLRKIRCSGLRRAFQREGGLSQKECLLLQCESEALFVFLT